MNALTRCTLFAAHKPSGFYIFIPQTVLSWPCLYETRSHNCVLLYYTLLPCVKRDAVNESFVCSILPTAAFKLFQSFSPCLPPVVEKSGCMNRCVLFVRCILLLMMKKCREVWEGCRKLVFLLILLYVNEAQESTETSICFASRALVIISDKCL